MLICGSPVWGAVGVLLVFLSVGAVGVLALMFTLMAPQPKAGLTKAGLTNISYYMVGVLCTRGLYEELTGSMIIVIAGNEDGNEEDSFKRIKDGIDSLWCKATHMHQDNALLGIEPKEIHWNVISTNLVLEMKLDMPQDTFEIQKGYLRSFQNA